MKIAYLLYMFPKLSESFILNEIVELLKKGHDVQIFSMREPMEDVMHEEVNAYLRSTKENSLFPAQPDIRSKFFKNIEILP